MSSATVDAAAAPAEGTNLRQRHGGAVAGAQGDQQQSPPALEEQHADEDARHKKTYGRTPDGTVFIVPTTHDMVSQLLDPRQPKNLSDVLVLAVLGLHILLAYYLPRSLKQPICALLFLFWRASYNVGIGFLLTVQSNHKLLVTWAKNWKLFEHPDTGKNPRPWLYKLLKRELEAKIPEDYSFGKAPIEYNTWLVFRRVVDLILMCDFVSYCLYAMVCGHQPEGENFLMSIARWVAGIVLVGFNLWVKLDAHRVVKDFAWYWGDFFYLIDQELTFDGVFEMAPHPMYSIGYAGYYGISMMAGSYKVLAISVVAHLAQFIFLVVVENPHIEKTYDPPAPRTRAPTQEGLELATPEARAEYEKKREEKTRETPTSVHDLMGLANFDIFRVTDYSIVLLSLYLFVIVLVTPRTLLWQGIFVAHAIIWRLWYSLGLGVILSMQSEEKTFTRHFLKYGDTVNEAFRQWKAMYHVSLIMCHGSFIAACVKMYDVPTDWGYGFALLKHVLGAGLVALQVWTAASIYDELGEFGWFFGDFFFESQRKLSYKSIYRFLNNPERIMGTAGLWGMSLITWSRSIFMIALTSQLLTLWFIAYVEKPHMQKIYGFNIRDEAGLTKFIKRSLPPPVKEWSLKADKVIDDTRHFVQDFVDSARPKLAAGVSTMVRDTTALFNSYPARLTITRLAPDLAGFDPKHYSLNVQGTSAPADGEAHSKESPQARTPQDSNRQVFEYGAPIEVRWTAPAHHSRKDWIGLYMVTTNTSRDVTEVSSLGRWVATVPGEFEPTADRTILATDEPVATAKDSDGVSLVSGAVRFEGDKLWWTQGVFEFRYHHGGNHNVMSISQPFEVRIGRFDEDSVIPSSNPRLYESAVEEALLPVVRNCLDRNPDIAPSSPEEPWGSHVERDSKYPKRIVYAVHHMFGIEFAPAVVPADGNVRKLAWRICNAKQVLAPYSMTRSRGPTTPVAEKFPEGVLSGN